MMQYREEELTAPPAASVMAAVNRELDRLHSSLGLADSEFFCECGAPGCRQRVPISRSGYARLRSEGRPVIGRAHAAPSAAESAELQALRAQVEQLERALVSRVRIEQAKGILAERQGITLEAAFEQLRSRARSGRRRLHGVCAEVIDGLAEADAGDARRSESDLAVVGRIGDRSGG